MIPITVLMLGSLSHQCCAFDVRTVAGVLGALRHSLDFQSCSLFLVSSQVPDDHLRRTVSRTLEGVVLRELSMAWFQLGVPFVFKQRRPLLVVPPGEEKEWIVTSQNLTLSGLRVLLFSHATLEELFGGLDVPFDSLVVLARHSGDVVTFTEVYRVKATLPLRTLPWGNWSWESGLRAPTLTIYRRRGDMQGAEIVGLQSKLSPFYKKTTKQDLQATNSVEEVWFIMGRMLNFRITYSASNKTGIYKDGNWTGTIGMLQRKEAHISMNTLVMTAQRSDAVDYTVPIIITKAGVFLSTPDSSHLNWDVYLEPFNPKLWACVIVTGVCIALSLTFINKLGRTHGTSESLEPSRFKFRDCLLLALGGFCAQGHWYTPRSWSCRMVYWITYIIGVVFIAAYSANLVAYLTLRKVKLPFSTLQELSRDNSYEFGVSQESGLYSIFENATDVVRKELFEKKLYRNRNHLSKSSLQELQRACNSQYAFMGIYRFVLAKLTDVSCNISTLAKETFPLYMGMALAKKSPYREIFNLALLDLRRFGILRRLFAVDVASVPTKPPLATNTVELMEIMPAFFVLMSGVALSAVVLLVEKGWLDKCLARLSRQKKPGQTSS